MAQKRYLFTQPHYWQIVAILWWKCKDSKKITKTSMSVHRAMQHIVMILGCICQVFKNTFVPVHIIHYYTIVTILWWKCIGSKKNCKSAIFGIRYFCMYQGERTSERMWHPVAILVAPCLPSCAPNPHTLSEGVFPAMIHNFHVFIQFKTWSVSWFSVMPC